MKMKAKSRKQMRKEFRKAKKIKKHEFFSKKKPKNKRFNKFSGQWDKGKKFITEKEKTTESEAFKVQKSSPKKVINKKEFKNLHERQDFERKKEKKERETLNREIKQQRIKQLKSDNMKEDIEIKKLEKQLKMNKGKSKAFALDGLDYLLDVCNKDVSQNEFEKTLQDSDSEFESDLDNIVGGPKKESKKKTKTVKWKDEVMEDETEDISQSEIGSDDDFMESEAENEELDMSELDEDDLSEAVESDLEEVVEKKSKKQNKNLKKKGIKENADSESEEVEKEKPKKLNKSQKKRKVDDSAIRTKNKKVKFEDEVESETSESFNETYEDEQFSSEEVGKENSQEVKKLWEDIYGRTRDEEGNIVKTYIPPHLRNKVEEVEDEKVNEKLARLKRQLKGLLNRLAESNMAFISNQIEQLYMSNSRNDMNQTLCNLLSESLMSEVLTPERLITEHAMLIAVLHSNIGSEIGAHFLQYAVTEFKKMLDSNPPVEDKRINNALLFIMHLYNFRIFHSKLMYDIINELIKNLEEKQIELLLTTFRTVGFNLRKDDPAALKAFVLKVQEQANLVTAGDNGTRLRFMLDMLMAIKNNNMSKIPNYNPEYVETLRKSLKVLIRKGNYSSELNISLQDLLNAEKHGRWWIVGSAWSGSAPSQPNFNTKESESSATTEFSQKLLDLARKQRMNTDIRRNIFCILMSAEDFLEAFEKLIKLKLKGAAEREIMNVLVHCALQEKNFNPYYVYLANKFCVFDRKYQMMLQCTVWDKIKELKNLIPVQVTNLAKFVGNVILERGLPISVLKVIQFSELDKPTIKFMRQVLLTVLVSEDRNAAVAVFARIAESPKLKLFRESLRLFLQHFVVKNTKNVEEEKVSKLLEMVKTVEQALTSSDVKMIF